MYLQSTTVLFYYSFAHSINNGNYYFIYMQHVLSITFFFSAIVFFSKISSSCYLYNTYHIDSGARLYRIASESHRSRETNEVAAML